MKFEFKNILRCAYFYIIIQERKYMRWVQKHAYLYFILAKIYNTTVKA